jgi:hypothetical protein
VVVSHWLSAPVGIRGLTLVLNVVAGFRQSVVGCLQRRLRDLLGECCDNSQDGPLSVTLRKVSRGLRFREGNKFAEVVRRLSQPSRRGSIGIARALIAWPSYSYVVPLHDLPSQWNRVEQNLRRLIGRCTELDMGHTNDDDFEASGSHFVEKPATI